MLRRFSNIDLLINSPTKEAVLVFLLWYRFVTLVHVAVLAITGIREIPLPSFALVVIYNILIFANRTTVIEKIQKYPYLLTIDLIMALIVRVDAGVYSNPYYLYSYSPLFLGGLLFGYRGAFLLASIQSAIMLLTDYTSDVGPAYRSVNKEFPITYIFFYLVVSIATAYLSELLKNLDKARKEKSNVALELKEAEKCLELSLLANRLSLREMQVLTLSANGKTTEQIAEELGVSQNTIKTYLKRVYEKLNVTSKKEAISLVTRQEVTIEQ